jgi:hypothetical protein
MATFILVIRCPENTQALVLIKRQLTAMEDRVIKFGSQGTAFFQIPSHTADMQRFHEKPCLQAFAYLFSTPLKGVLNCLTGFLE